MVRAASQAGRRLAPGPPAAGRTGRDELRQDPRSYTASASGSTNWLLYSSA